MSGTMLIEDRFYHEVMDRLPSVSFDPQDDVYYRKRERQLIEAVIRSLYRSCWTPDEAEEYMLCTLYFSPHLKEEQALSKMATVRVRVELRLSRGKGS